MSYAERAYFIHFPLRYNNSVKISLFEDGYAGLPVETQSKLQIFNLEYEESPSLIKPILPSALTAYFAASNQQFIDDLVNSAEQQFLLQVQIGLDVVWRGFVRPGLTDVREIESPKLVGITAVDGIALMEKNFFSRGNLSRRTIDAVLTDLLGTYEDDLSDWDSTELRQISADATKTIFELAYLNPEPFYSGDPSDPQPLNQRFVLAQILSRFSSRAMYWAGWKIDSIDTQKSWQPAINVTTQDFGTDLETSYLPAYGQAKLEYLHRAGARIFEVDAGQEYNVSGFSQTINFSTNGGEAFSIDGYVQSQQSAISGFDIGLPTYFEISLLTDTHYWDHASRQWRVGSAANRFNVFDLPLFSTVPIRGRYRLEVSTPPLATTQITLAISAIKQEGGSSSTINTYTFEASVNDYSIVEGDTEVLYGIQSDANEANDFGSYLLGDTVGIQTPTALTYSSGTPTKNWRNGVSDPSPAFYEPLNQVTIRTFLGYHKSPRKILRGTLTNASYTPDRLLIFGGKSFRFCGGTWSGQTGFWQGSWIELTYETPTVTFDSYAENVQDFGSINLPTATDSLLYVRSVTGDVEIVYTPAGTGGGSDTNGVFWNGISVELEDGTIFSPANGQAFFAYFNPLASSPPVGYLHDDYYGNFSGIQVKAPTNPFSVGQTVYIHAPNRPTPYQATVSSSSNDVDDIWNVALSSAIDIYAPDGTAVTNTPFVDSWEVQVFYYDRIDDAIEHTTLSAWEAGAEFLNRTRYTLLWRVEQDLSINLAQGDPLNLSLAFEGVASSISDITASKNLKRQAKTTEDWVLEQIAESEAIDRTIIASLSAGASGLGVTSLSISGLNIRDTVKAGTTLWVYQASTPGNKETVVLSADLAPGDSTISIVSKDLSNSYSSGDKVSLNVTGVFSFFDNYLQDAPSDTKTYGRKDGQWVEIVVGGTTPDLSNYPSIANYGANQIPIANAAGDGWVAIGRSGIDNRTVFPTNKAAITDFNEADYATSGHGHGIDEITGLQGALDAKQATLNNGDVGNNLLANMANATIKGRITTGAGAPEDLSAVQVLSILGLDNGTTNNNRFLKSTATRGAFTWSVISKSDVGLDNVDNTADADKPISTAVSNALTAKENTFTKNSAFNKNFAGSGSATTVARSDHNHAGVYEPAFTKNTAFNKAFGTTAGTVAEGNHTHSQYLTAVGTTNINNDAVTNAKLANMNPNTIKGRAALGGDPQDLSAAQARGILNVADGATANSSDTFLLNRANHTGEQTINTITGLQTELNAFDLDITAIYNLLDDKLDKPTTNIFDIPFPVGSAFILRAEYPNATKTFRIFLSDTEARIQTASGSDLLTINASGHAVFTGNVTAPNFILS